MLFISGRNETSIIPAWQKLMGLNPFTLTVQDKKHAGVQFLSTWNYCQQMAPITKQDGIWL